MSLYDALEFSPVFLFLTNLARLPARDAAGSTLKKLEAINLSVAESSTLSSCFHAVNRSRCIGKSVSHLPSYNFTNSLLFKFSLHLPACSLILFCSTVKKADWRGKTTFIYRSNNNRFILYLVNLLQELEVKTFSRC